MNQRKSPTVICWITNAPVHAAASWRVGTPEEAATRQEAAAMHGSVYDMIQHNSPTVMLDWRVGTPEEAATCQEASRQVGTPEEAATHQEASVRRRAYDPA